MFRPACGCARWTCYAPCARRCVEFCARENKPLACAACKAPYARGDVSQILLNSRDAATETGPGPGTGTGGAGAGAAWDPRASFRLSPDEAALLAKWERQQLDRTVAALPGVVRCPLARCGNVFSLDGGGGGFSFCARCRNLYHFRGDCGEVAAATRAW